MDSLEKKQAIQQMLKDTYRLYDKETRVWRYYRNDTDEEVDPKAVQLLSNTPSKNKYCFNFEMAMRIIDNVRRGHTFAEIADMGDMPPIEIIRYWENMHPVFAESLDIARKDRAEGYHDNIISMANEMMKGTFDKDQVNASKVAIDAYKWAAEKGNPDRYARKTETKHTGEVQPTVININTGIKRETTKTLDDIIVKPNKVDKDKEEQ
jgi:hypothetical protein